MDKTNTKNKLVRLTLRFAAVFFVTLALLTYFSGTINRMLLPVVETVKATSGTFSQDISGTTILNGENEDNMYFTFEITKAQRKYLSDDTLISVTFDAFDELHRVYKTKTEMTPCKEITYNKDKDNYTVVANMPDCELEPGEVMPSVYDDIFYSITVSSDYYDLIVPQSAVADGSLFVLYDNEDGTGTVEQISVDIIATDDVYYAVSGNIYDNSVNVVVYTTKDIKSGDTVAVKGAD